MKKILYINACVRSKSRTHVLAQHVLQKLKGTVEEIALATTPLQPLDNDLLKERDQALAKTDFSAPVFKYAQQFATADEIVIAAPYWDLMFPACLKVYLETISVCGICFKYTQEGKLQNLCKAQRIIYITTSGGAIGNNHFGYNYIQALAHTLYGIPEVICIQAENLDIRGIDPQAILSKTIKQIEEIL